MERPAPAVVWETLYSQTRDCGQKGTYVEAMSAMDIVLWDLLGQELGEPISTLLGGRFREQVMAYGTGAYYEHTDFDAGRDLPALAEQVRRPASRCMRSRSRPKISRATGGCERHWHSDLRR